MLGLGLKSRRGCRIRIFNYMISHEAHIFLREGGKSLQNLSRGEVAEKKNSSYSGRVIMV
jgi:hypothetical protein